jgi:hypothetical protein
LRSHGGAPMKTSPNGGVIMSGAGVAAVRKRIEDAFASIHTNIDTNANLPEIQIVEEVKLEVAPVTQVSLHPLSEKAEPILRAAVQCHKDPVAATHHSAVHRSAVHTISVPRKSAEQLIEEALQLLGRKR